MLDGYAMRDSRYSDDDGANNLKHMMQRAEIGLLPLAARTSADGHSDAGGAGLSLKVRVGAWLRMRGLCALLCVCDVCACIYTPLSSPPLLSPPRRSFQ